MDSPRPVAVAFIAVGSNVEPEQNIVAALTMLRERMRVRASSTFYQTEPLGDRKQPDFVNGVWRVETVLSPVEIKTDVLGAIEGRLGRVRTADKFAPRTLDLDLVLYNDLVTDEGDLILPQTDIQRPFVHSPILELLTGAGSEVEPGLLEAISALLPAELPHTLPGKPLHDLTGRLRRLLT
jgi:2-amino-4-hydroxy-6-hydroxymethyldihydropteridine diphosphokinase